MYKAYNDYELLYLANDYQDMVALDILVNKYSKFIYKKIISFFPQEVEIDDYYQEGLLCLYRSIQSFNDKYNKTFMRYFEVIIDRSFINMYHRNKRELEKKHLIINEFIVSSTFEKEQIEKRELPKVSLKSPVEQIVYDLYFKRGKKISYIAQKLKRNKKQIYNTIYRIRQKVEQILKND